MAGCAMIGDWATSSTMITRVKRRVRRWHRTGGVEPPGKRCRCLRIPERMNNLLSGLRIAIIASFVSPVRAYVRHQRFRFVVGSREVASCCTVYNSVLPSPLLSRYPHSLSIYIYVYTVIYTYIYAYVYTITTNAVQYARAQNESAGSFSRDRSRK